MEKCLNKEYDVALSFAGEDREYVEKTAEILINSGIKVFYDMYEDVNLWGKDLYQHLDDVYQNKSKYAVIFISENYSKKLWTNHELKSAQARAFSENTEYILPARFDDTEIPGIRKTTGYVSLTELSPNKFAEKIIKKLGVIEPSDFLPKKIKYIDQTLQYLFDDLNKDEIVECVVYVFNVLKLTNTKERLLLLHLVMQSCRHNFLEDLHEDIRLIERSSGIERNKIVDIAKNLTSLGFEYRIEKNSHGCIKEQNELETDVLYLKLISREPHLALDNLTIVLLTMFFAPMEFRCLSCCTSAIERLDFTDLKEDVNIEDLNKLLYLTSDFEDENFKDSE